MMYIKNFNESVKLTRNNKFSKVAGYMFTILVINYTITPENM